MSTKTHFETNIIQRYKNGESSYRISKDEKCSYNAVLRELKRKGINTGLRFWNEKEIEKLKNVYSVNSKEELLKEFPDRNAKSIGTMANKLGLKKREYEKVCEGCRKRFTIKFRGKCGYKQGLCSKCSKRKWECGNLENGLKRKKQWLLRNPAYMKQYVRRPEVKKRVNIYLKQLRKTSPKYHLDCNMGMAIYMALKQKKNGRQWESLVDYTVEELMVHLEGGFDENMTWENYGTYWHIDHIKPRSLFKYTSSDDLEFKNCWSLKNLQPLEKSANLKKSNTFQL